MAQRLRPDLIVLDLMMPEMSGFEVVAKLRRSDETAQIPILVVTAKDITPHDISALNADHGKVVQIVEKAAFSHSRFITEVRRALLPTAKAN